MTQAARYLTFAQLDLGVGAEWGIPFPIYPTCGAEPQDRSLPDSQGCRWKRNRWQVIGQSAILE
jgi:hypothetical protein